VETTVVRNYGEVSFLLDRKTKHSIFLEGPLAGLASQFLHDPNYLIPDSFLTKFLPKDRKEILADCAEIRRAVLSLSNPPKKVSKIRSPLPPQKNALEELSGYAIKNWQIVNVNFELTHLCNQRCQWCYLENFQQRGMSRERIVLLLAKLKKVGALFLLLTGGEIFSRPDALDIMEDIEEAGFVLEIKTNGTLLTPKKIEKLARFHPFDIQVSIYETHTGYSDLTKSLYRFDLIKENVGLMLKNYLPVTLSVLVGKHNIDEIEKIHEKLIATGAEVFYSPYLTSKRGGQGQEVLFRLSRKEMEEKFKPFLEKIYAFPVQKKYRDCKYNSTVCYAGRDQIAISPDGHVFPCLDLGIPLGDLSHESLDEILVRRKNILNQFTLREMPQCNKCADRDYCDSCVGLALLENHNYRMPSQHKCDVIKFYAQNRTN
jgi:radical SAM protein with 4Fe4S-binding SPASM domain